MQLSVTASTLEMLENRLKMMDQAVTDLHATHEETKQLCHTHEQTAEDRLAAIHALEAEREALKGRIDSLMTDVSAKDAAVENLRSELDSARAVAVNTRDLEDGHRDLSEKVGRLEQYEKEAMMLRSNVASHQTRVTELEAEKTTFTSRIAELEAVLATAHKTTAEWESRHDALQSEQGELREREQQSLTRIGELENLLEEVRKSSEEKIRTLQADVGQVAEAKEEVATLKSAVAALEDEKNGLREKLDQSARRIAELEVVAEAALKLRESYSASQRKVGEVEELRVREVEGLKSELQGMQGRLDEIQREKDGLKGLVEERDGKIKVLEMRAADVEARAAKVEGEAEALRLAISSLEEKNRGLDGRVTDGERVEAELLAVKAEIDALKVEKEAGYTQAKALLVNKEALLVEIEQGKNKVKELEDRLDGADKVRALLTEAEGQIKDLQSQVETHGVEKEGLNRQLNERTLQHQEGVAKITDLSLKMEEQQAVISRLESDALTTGEKLAGLEQKERELQELRKEVDSLQGVVAETTRTGEMYSAQISTLNASLDEKEKRVQALETLIGELREAEVFRDRGVQDQVQQLRKQVEGLVKERDIARKGWEDSASLLTSAQAQIQQLERAMEERAGDGGARELPHGDGVSLLSKNTDAASHVTNLADERDALKAEVEQLRSHIAALELSRRRSVSTEQRMGTRRVVPPEPSSLIPPSPGPSVDSSTVPTPPRKVTRRDSATSTSTDWLQDASKTELEDLVSKLSFQLSTAEKYIKNQQEAALRLKDDIEREREEAAAAIAAKTQANAVWAAQIQQLKERAERQVAEIAELAFEATKANKEAETARRETKEARRKCAELEQSLYDLKRSSKSYNKPLPTPPGTAGGTPGRNGVDRGTMSVGTSTSPVLSPQQQQGRKMSWGKGVDETVAPMIDLDLIPSLLFEELTRPSSNGRGSIEVERGPTMGQQQQQGGNGNGNARNWGTTTSPVLFADTALSGGRYGATHRSTETLRDVRGIQSMDEDRTTVALSRTNSRGHQQPLSPPPSPPGYPAPQPIPDATRNITNLAAAKSRIDDLQRQVGYLEDARREAEWRVAILEGRRGGGGSERAVSDGVSLATSHGNGVDVGTQVRKKKSFWKKVKERDFRRGDDEL
ncbi:hypothetical protein HDV00_005627 [Rhizophlyctis rosea]|nr:hypothetical protein HDV00_005627 [Rhizophlyctis rosea]